MQALSREEIGLNTSVLRRVVSYSQHGWLFSKVFGSPMSILSHVASQRKYPDYPV